MTRRQLLLGMPAFLQNRPQRVIVLMVDGLGADYIAASAMPVLSSWQKTGIGKIVDGVMPSVTNANNTSICCGVWPEKHGITANFYLDETTGREEYMESADLVLAPTLFERARPAGVTSALLSSKKKTITLLPRGASLVLSAEIPTARMDRTPRQGPGHLQRGDQSLAPQGRPVDSPPSTRGRRSSTSTPRITRCTCGRPRPSPRDAISRNSTLSWASARPPLPMPHSC